MACLNRFQPDVLHSYMGTANNLSVLAKAVKPALKVVWGIRSTKVDFAYYGKLARLDSFVQSLFSRFADRIIANSFRGMHDAIDSGVKAESFLVIPNGIDTNFYVPDRDTGKNLRSQWGIKPNESLIGLIGRLDPMKAHEDFLNAARIVADANPTVRFVCVGDGPLAVQLKKMSADMGLSEVVTWAGPHTDMPAVYNSLDMCCLASVFGEGFPNVLGEAMSCGVPCITTDVGDAAEVVGDTGAVVPKSDSKSLAEALLMMVKRISYDDIPDTRSRIEEHFSLERMVVATETLLSEILR